jgi:hypothetical protein
MNMRSLCRLSLGFALALTSVAAFAQDYGKKITFTHVAAPAKTVLDALSAEAGVTLLTSPVIATETLVIDVRDVTLADLMKRLSDALNADWREERGGIRLVRSPARQKAEQDAELAKRLSEMSKALEKQRTLEKGMKPFDAAEADDLARAMEALSKSQTTNEWNEHLYRRANALDQRTPGLRAVTRILTKFSAEQLVALPENERIVFSSQPTPMQRPMTPAMLAEVQRFVAEQNVWAAAAKKIWPTEEHVDGGPWISGMYWRKEIAGVPRKSLLTIRKDSFGRYLNCELRVYDEKGQLVASGSQSLHSLTYEDHQEIAKRIEEASGKEEPVAFSEEAITIGKLFTRMYGSEQDEVEVPPALMQKLLNPEKHDPLSWGATEALLAIARARDANLVAVLSDMLVSLAYAYGSEKVTPSRIWMGLTSYTQMAHREEEGWLVLWPEEREKSRLFSADRAVLGQLLRSAVPRGRLSFEDKILMAKALPDANDAMMSSLVYFANAVVGDRTMMQWDQPWAALKLLGSLTPHQLQALQSGQKLVYRSLTPEQKQLLHRQIFHSNDAGYRLEPDWELVDHSQMQNYWNSLMQEPTESLPNGIDANATLELTVSKDAVALATSSAPQEVHWGDQDMDAYNLAHQIMYKERPDLFPWAESYPKFDRFIPASRTSYAFHFRPDPKLLHSLNCKDLVYEKNQKPVPLDQLPKDFQAEVNKRVAELREAYKNHKPGEFGGGRRQNAPPPGP